ncbi:probable Phosphoribosylformylglycinamidine synthase [Hanseniaspora guilliermondii]|uniref:Phosphoribosylformylglycinamidine synthase n=1 Tax=Hanseniaspora guilliermondii TaxID=56406 RepID=A0A1L0AZX6_9ASCO|nr:probable Phosphoribosylformylglycinamidine synthase [Hanseniaspora guilliermondii]
MTIIASTGPVAFSDFRITNIISDLSSKINVPCEQISIESAFIHYIELLSNNTVLDDNQKSHLFNLLKYDPFPSNQSLYNIINDDLSSLESNESQSFVVRIIPRQGTISPWSSKATNIVQVCGLEDVCKRVERGILLLININSDKEVTLNGNALSSCFDRMTQDLFINQKPDLMTYFNQTGSPKPLQTIQFHNLPTYQEKYDILNEYNKKRGLALDDGEMKYLIESFVDRSPTDVELFSFAQVNSEHCRHKIFNASWEIDGIQKPMSLFQMIKNTFKKTPDFVVSAYSDNAAVMNLKHINNEYYMSPDYKTKMWNQQLEQVHLLMKVETHNHPTAISPFPGASTGSGGEIRDEGATGRGSKTKCGLSGFAVSNLNIPGFIQPWEEKFLSEQSKLGKPAHVASSLDIMIEAPLGSAAFNNEFGRPNINGYFRTLTLETFIKDDQQKTGGIKRDIRGFHKPIMLAGGMGSIRPEFALKNTPIKPNDLLIVLGGQGMLIGLGGGAASSGNTEDGNADLDFASVQRGNPEMERRCQEVINACVSLGPNRDNDISSRGNPIRSIHDVGAGGLSNALPELVHDNNLGAVFDLRKILTLEPNMSPLEIWCNESQERYVLGIDPKDLPLFEEICLRERAPFAVVGHATAEEKLVLKDPLLNSTPIDLDMDILFGKPPKMSKSAITSDLILKAADLSSITFDDALGKVLSLPAVASKSFLITIGDRTVTGLIDRDQFVGPYQTPVADCGVTATSLPPATSSIKDISHAQGEALSMGERPTLALISAAGSAKMSIAESLLNIISADIKSLRNCKISANWMSPASHEGEGSKLYEAVQAIGMDLCPDLDLAIPVGKDSMSMKMKWKDSKNAEVKEVTAPLSLNITCFSAVSDTTRTWTPELNTKNLNKGSLVYVDLANGFKTLGGSALLQVYNQLGDECPTVRNNLLLKNFINACIELHQTNIVESYHDISDGGLITTLLEMAFTSRCGIDLDLPINDQGELISYLFNEELGAVFQVSDHEEFVKVMNKFDIKSEYIHQIGTLNCTNKLMIKDTKGQAIHESLILSHLKTWSETSYQIQKLRDNPLAATEEFNNLDSFNSSKGIQYKIPYKVGPQDASLLDASRKPKVAILREQGVNGHYEMAWSFQQAGFDTYDVTMTDLLSKKVSLKDFVGLAACGGFSYGDVLGAGNGWATSVLYNDYLKKEFNDFFNVRQDTFAIGICNGCQFLTRLGDLINGDKSENKWPIFTRNRSEQYEARVCVVKVSDEVDEKNIFFKDMEGAEIPIAVAHGEGQATFINKTVDDFEAAKLCPIRYVDYNGEVTQVHPYNPNGSPNGIAGCISENGRVLSMMPHPERVVRLEANSYYPKESSEEWKGYGPWIQLFKNCRRWVADNF